MTDIVSVGEDERSAAFVPDATPGVGPDTRDRLSLAKKLPRSCQRTAGSSSPDNKNKTSSTETTSIQQIEKKLQHHMDIEDKRVGDVAEGILYEFLPAAFNAIIPLCDDPRTELTHERCKLVASAALCVGALLNAPPPFLEFLLRIPWQKIEDLHRNARDPDWIQQQLEIPEALRRELVNTPIDQKLMPTVLEFLFSDAFQGSLPPQLKSSGKTGQQSHLENVAALLDGAGPLHCASIRGNPAQVDHLLYCGADPTLKTNPGDLPLQLVPFCGEKSAHSGERICRCMAQKDQEIWECRSSSARALIVKKCFFQVGQGIAAWLTLVVLCILNVLGLWGCHPSLPERSVITKHVKHQKEVKSTKAYLEAQRLLNEMRKEARPGHEFLSAARQIPWSQLSNGKPRIHDSRRPEALCARFHSTNVSVFVPSVIFYEETVSLSPFSVVYASTTQLRVFLF